MQGELGALVVGVMVEVFDPVSVEGRCPPDDPVNLVTLGQQQIGQVRTILSRDTADQGRLHAFASIEGMGSKTARWMRPARSRSPFAHLTPFSDRMPGM